MNPNAPVPGTFVITPQTRTNSITQEQAASVLSRQLTMQFMPLLRNRQRSAGLKPTTDLKEVKELKEVPSENEKVTIAVQNLKSDANG